MSKRGHYGRWSENDLLLAIAAYKNGDYGLNECSRVFKIPKATIKRHANEKNSVSNNIKAFGRPPTFSADMEKIISEHIVHLEKCFFGLTMNEVRKLAFDVAENYDLPHTFSKDKKIAGKKWFYAFLKRNPGLSIRKPERTTSAKGFNRENVTDFFNHLEKIVDEHSFTAVNIFSVDKSGFTTQQNVLPKIIVRKGKHLVESGDKTTMVCAVSAAGQYIPPMIIYKRKKFHKDLNIGAPPASIVTISDTGCLNTELFMEWLKHFQKHAKSKIDNKVLLLLDGDTTHSKNLQACEFARRNGIVILQLPGHSTDRLRPLDVTFFGPLQTYFTHAKETFLQVHKADKIDQTKMSKLLNEAYGRAATVGMAESGFCITGIWPVNRHVFTDDQFAPDDVLQYCGTPAENSSSDDEDDHDVVSDNESQNENKRFKSLLEEISLLEGPPCINSPESSGNNQ